MPAADVATATAPAVDELETAAAALAVAAGATHLDQQVPGWPDMVDLDRLDIREPERCILGQVYGWYYDVPLSLDEAVRMGFDADRSGLDLTTHEADAALSARYAALHTEWARLIRARRGEVNGDG